MVTVVSLSSSQQLVTEFCSEQAELIPHSHSLPLFKIHTCFFYIHFSGKKERKKIMWKKTIITILTERKKKNKKPFNGNISTDSTEEK